MNDLSKNHCMRFLETLKEFDVFKKVETATLSKMLNEMRVEKWPSKSFWNGSGRSTSMHFILSGRLKVYQVNALTDREHTIFILTKGDMFDVLHLLDNEPHDVFWEALDYMELLTVPIEKMIEWIISYPEINKTLLQYLGQRMRRLETMTLDISFHNTLVRLANLLLTNINGETNNLQLINNLSNDEIAGLIGTTRAVVNRHIQELKKCGAITVQRKSIQVNSIETLLSIVEKKHHF